MNFVDIFTELESLNNEGRKHLVIKGKMLFATDHMEVGLCAIQGIEEERILERVCYFND